MRSGTSGWGSSSWKAASMTSASRAACAAGEAHEGRARRHRTSGSRWLRPVRSCAARPANHNGICSPETPVYAKAGSRPDRANSVSLT